MKWLLSLFLVVFLMGGGYVGYLSALVDLDEQRFLEEVSAATDTERLRRDLARAKSIVEARKRAYIRRSQEFLRQLKSKPLRAKPVSEKPPGPLSGPSFILPSEEVFIPTPLKPLEKTEDYESFRGSIKNIPPGEMPLEIAKLLPALEREEEDIVFFEEQVKVIEEVIQRQAPKEEVKKAVSKKNRKVSDGVQKVLQLVDKQKNLIDQKKLAKKKTSFWEGNTVKIPQEISLSVNSKDGLTRAIASTHSAQISTALSIMPPHFEQRVKNLYIVYGDPKMRRGMTGVGVVFMKGEEKDFFRVLVHEFGHAYDLHREVAEGEKSEFYDGPYRLFSADPSVAYYSYAWKNTVDRIFDLPAFASSYAMSDPFEDFAEAFALYVLQGKTFAKWKNEHESMNKKWSFFQDVFLGRTFDASRIFSARPYDVTMMEIDYDTLLK